MYSENSDASYYHFGDLDAGGFYIFEHLKKRTGIPFRTLHMDVDTLRKNRTAVKPITKNDETRLLRLLENADDECEYTDVIRLMLDEGIKLEQEAVSL